MPLKITKVTSATVEGNYQWAFARVYAGELFGTGEGFYAPELEGVIKQFGRLLVGENALEINRLFEKMYWASVPSGYSGVNFHAISAIETALLDLAGKFLNVPIYTLLGGKLRDKIRIYVDTHAGKSLEAMDAVVLPARPKWMQEIQGKRGGKKEEQGDEPIHGRMTTGKYSEAYTPKAYASRARLMKSEGFTAIKFDLDVPTPFTQEYNLSSGSLTNSETSYLSDLVGAVREAVGDDTDILFDLHWRYNVQSSIALAKAIEKYNVMWLEDPVPPGDPSLIDVVANATSTPIATGENLYGRYGFAPLLNTKVRIVTPDAMKAGGLLETKLIAQMAQIKEMVLSPHNIGSPIGTLAQAHVAAAVPNFGVLEFHGRDVPIWAKLVKKKNVIHSGFIELNDEAGLGIELDEKVAAKYALNEKFDL
ncbi:MAG: mandelate racemase/muconate lactonizing enzyme family protein [Thaumarchaeota archaeon]|nr:mandelate racemase/muconate lactonizing enzyme family protein [Nitrososphaerota archaeon]